jgi:S1-C subfamily serine protease
MRHRRSLTFALLLVSGCRWDGGAPPERRSPPKVAPPPESVIPERVAPPSAPPPAPAREKPEAAFRTEDERNTIAVFRSVAPSTVFVTQRRLQYDFWEGALEVPTGSGSGFVWDEAGHVVTNFHVIDGAQ